MTKLLSIKMDNFISGLQRGVPVTLGFTLETDGAPPPVGSRLQFRVSRDVTLLHASMPPSGAQMINHDALRFSTVVIADAQSPGWNRQRTLTLKA